ncbi:MAG: 30S ribosomal protein S5 [Thermodesulfobacteriota bacterium]
MVETKINPSGLDLKEKIVHIRRVSKVTKGGKRFHFTALAVVGNADGVVGTGLGKSNEVPDAIRKAIEKAKKGLIKIPRNGSTIPHEVYSEHVSSKIMLLPAAPGTGVIAGGPVRAVVELAGIQDILSKVQGSRNPLNVVLAAIKGLTQLRMPEEIAKIRNKDLKDLDLPNYYVIQ